jgi:hypothetical protein
MHSRKFTISRDCSHCESETAYTINIESSTHWYSLVAQENKNNKKRGLYFLCSNCYAKQTDKNSEWNTIWQNRKGLDIKQKVSIITRSKLKTSFMQKIIAKAIEEVTTV